MQRIQRLGGQGGGEACKGCKVKCAKGALSQGSMVGQPEEHGN